MRPLLLFDDGHGTLAPLNDLRPAFDVRTGALTTRRRIELQLDRRCERMIVPEPLAAICAEAHPTASVNIFTDDQQSVLAVNGRWIGAEPAPFASLGEGAAVTERQSGRLVAAAGPIEQIREWITNPPNHARHIDGPALMTRPWHVVGASESLIRCDLPLITADGHWGKPKHGVSFGDHDVFVHPDATVLPATVFDSTSGPIVIDAGAVVRPRATIIGPVWIGPGSTVLDGAIIKSGTAIGPVCKVAGEIGGTIFQGYANKSHDGHIGNSWVGSWTNLGAGTTNSNLLNTYELVIARALPGGPTERTDEVFLGAMIGDHCKFAIQTRIMTGAVIHTGVMYAATASASGCIDRFSWLTDATHSRFRLDKFLNVARTVMGRRKVELTPAIQARLTALHAHTVSQADAS